MRRCLGLLDEMDSAADKIQEANLAVEQAVGFVRAIVVLDQVPAADVAGALRMCEGDSSFAKTFRAHQDRIHRITPRKNSKVNRWWICNDGRYDYPHVHDPGFKIRMKDFPIRKDFRKLLKLNQRSFLE